MSNISFDEAFHSPKGRSDSNNARRLRRAQRQLRQAMARELTERQAQVVELHFFQQMSQSDIARELGVHPSTVSRTLHRATLRLHRVLRYTMDA